MKVRKSTAPKTKKVSEAEVKLRVHTIFNMILGGASRFDILRHSSSQWGVCDRQADEYMRRADLEIDKWADRLSRNSVKRSLSRREKIYMKAMELGQINVALEVARDTDKLRGNYPEEKQRHILDGKVEVEDKKAVDLSKLSSDQLEKIVTKVLGNEPGKVKKGD